MPVHLQREIEKLKRQILSLCGMVEVNVGKAVDSFAARDVALAREVVANDDEIDRVEVDVEEECLKILALHQPVAVDLRYIIAMLKIDRDLERIGDLAVHVAEQAVLMAGDASAPRQSEVHRLSGKVVAMVRKSLDAVMDMDAVLAGQVWRGDDEIDAMNEEFHRGAEEEIRRHPENWKSVLAGLAVSRCLERIADHATNIAKDVIYLAEGRIVRHRGDEFKQGAAPVTAAPPRERL